jgi:hypothetical protein
VRWWAAERRQAAAKEEVALSVVTTRESEVRNVSSDDITKS